MRKTKLVLGSLLMVGTVFGPGATAGATTRNPMQSRGGSVNVMAPSLGYTCTNGTCSCTGTADCEDMFGDMSCASDWIDETDPLAPFGECKGSTRIRETPKDSPLLWTPTFTPTSSLALAK